jgi:hypothetical protein
MKTWRSVAVDKLGVLVVLLFIGANFTLQAQIYNGVRPPPGNWLRQYPMLAKNPAALELVPNLLAGPQPELSVPEISRTNSGPSGTYWTLNVLAP